MKVPVVDEESKDDVLDPEQIEVVDGDAPAAEDKDGAASDADLEAEEPEPELDPEAEERARVEAAIRAGEEAAEAELAADAKKVAAERDELAHKLGDAEDAVEAAQKKAAEAQDKLLRLQADWDNYRRRTATERLAEKERAAEGLVSNLLPVIDDLERALEHAGAEDADEKFKQFVDGVDAVRAKMLGILAKEGVEAIDPAGEAFDPLAHQAVGRVEDAEAFDETVAQVYQKGYRMGGKVIRNAMVTVTYGGAKRPAFSARRLATPRPRVSAGKKA